MGSLNQRIGSLAEISPNILMEKFNNQLVDSKQAFGLDEGEVTLPLFQGKIEKRSGKIIEGSPIELDLIAKSTDENWFVEVKYWKKPVGKSEVDKFLKKLDELNQGETKTLIGWFFSRKGFGKPARDKLIASKIRHTDSEGFNYLADIVGCVRLPQTEVCDSP